MVVHKRNDFKIASEFFDYPFHTSRINLLSRAVRQTYLAQTVNTF